MPSQSVLRETCLLHILHALMGTCAALVDAHINSYPLRGLLVELLHAVFVEERAKPGKRFK